MQELVCKVNPFILKQQIYSINPETQEKTLVAICNFSDLSDTLKTLIQQDQIYTLHLMGEQRFTEMIGKEVEDYLNLNYGLADIYIKYNE